VNADNVERSAYVKPPRGWTDQKAQDGAIFTGGHHDENEVGASDRCIRFGGLRRPRREILARERDLAIVGHF
jgi:hypothetical protein